MSTVKGHDVRFPKTQEKNYIKKSNKQQGGGGTCL